ncbi:Dual specificity tyrosine-phosphorylation-regulated kinase [Entophlyctis sp. JEL0112]|nr:Dual specificity tyrosine-phosphorylation-regulated kinase [Entophlyctis sp. JEL0112]
MSAATQIHAEVDADAVDELAYAFDVNLGPDVVTDGGAGLLAASLAPMVGSRPTLSEDDDRQFAAISSAFGDVLEEDESSKSSSVIAEPARKHTVQAATLNSVKPSGPPPDKSLGPSIRRSRAKSFGAGGPVKPSIDTKSANSTSSKSNVKSAKIISGVDVPSPPFAAASSEILPNRKSGPLSSTGKHKKPPSVGKKPSGPPTAPAFSSSVSKKSNSSVVMSSPSSSSSVNSLSRDESRDSRKGKMNQVAHTKSLSAVKTIDSVPAAAEPENVKLDQSQRIKTPPVQFAAHLPATSTPQIAPNIPLPAAPLTALQAIQMIQQQRAQHQEERENPQPKSYPPASSLKLPLSPDVTLHYFRALLTPYEQEEVLNYPEIWFAGSSGVQKIGSSNRRTGAQGIGVNIPGSGTENDDEASSTTKDEGYHNFGYDDARGDFYLTHHDHIAYRYEMISLLGKGSFGQCVKCFDHKLKRNVAIKIIRNKKRFEQQGLIEVKVLERLKVDESGKNNYAVQMHESFTFRGHLCISFEILGINLYEWTKAGGYRGIHTGLIKRFAFQILKCLELLSMNDIVHCDLKPENILLADPSYLQPNRYDLAPVPDSGYNRSSSFLPPDFKPSNPQYNLKVIDLGSSCFSNEKVYTYVQSRFYRSPEVILGMSYNVAIDMWSFGCILAELFLGYPLFPGENELQQLALIMEIFGVPPMDVLERGSRSKLFFDLATGSPRIVTDNKGKRRKPNSKTLANVLRTNDSVFIEFLQGCLEWNPDLRFTPTEALAHEWMREYDEAGSSSTAAKKILQASLKSANGLGGRSVSTSSAQSRSINRKVVALPSVDTNRVSAKANLNSARSAIGSGSAPAAGKKQATLLRASFSGAAGSGTVSAGAGSTTQARSSGLPPISTSSTVARNSVYGGMIGSAAQPNAHAVRKQQSMGANLSRSFTHGHGSKNRKDSSKAGVDLKPSKGVAQSNSVPNLRNQPSETREVRRWSSASSVRPAFKGGGAHVVAKGDDPYLIQRINKILSLDLKPEPSIPMPPSRRGSVMPKVTYEARHSVVEQNAKTRLPNEAPTEVVLHLPKEKEKEKTVSFEDGNFNELEFLKNNFERARHEYEQALKTLNHRFHISEISLKDIDEIHRYQKAALDKIAKNESEKVPTPKTLSLSKISESTFKPSDILSNSNLPTPNPNPEKVSIEVEVIQNVRSSVLKNSPISSNAQTAVSHESIAGCRTRGSGYLTKFMTKKLASQNNSTDSLRRLSIPNRFSSGLDPPKIQRSKMIDWKPMSQKNLLRNRTSHKNRSTDNSKTVPQENPESIIEVEKGSHATVQDRNTHPAAVPKQLPVNAKVKVSLPNIVSSAKQAKPKIIGKSRPVLGDFERSLQQFAVPSLRKSQPYHSKSTQEERDLAASIPQHLVGANFRVAEM